MGFKFLAGFGFGLGVGLFAPRAMAQNITLDGTLGPAGTLQGPVYEIEQELGTTVRENLFHSFEQFNLEAGEQANFSSDVGIENILTRVTGGSSSIDGLLSTTSDAVNLFFINPSGILFGPNSRLDIGGPTRGSFFATTMDGLIWPDGSRLDGVTPVGEEGLLNIVGNPSGFFATNRSLGDIQIDGGQLNVRSGQSLLLLGGNVAATNGFLYVDFPDGGRIEIGAVTPAGTLPLAVDGNSWSVRMSENLGRGNVSLVGTTVEVAADSGGDLSIYGNDVEISDGSFLLAGIRRNGGFEGAQAGTLLIDAQGEAIVKETSRIANFLSSGAVGKGGDLLINAHVLEVIDGAQLTASTLGKGDAGNVQISSSERVLFQGGSIDGRFTSAAFSHVESGAVGKGGDVVIDAPVLEVIDGAGLSAETRGEGDAGDIQISSSEQVLLWNSFGVSNVASGAVGKGGDVVIDAPVLEVTDGARLSASTSGKGAAGNVRISSSERVLFQNSFAISNVFEEAVGKGGNVLIEAPVLEVTDDAGLSASTLGEGDAGNVRISSSERVLFRGRSVDGSSSSAAFSNVANGAVGNGGNVLIDAPILEIIDGARLSASTFGEGDAGNVKISSSERVLFRGRSVDGSSSSAATTSVFAGAVGDGGDVLIDAPILEVTDGAQLSASTFGAGNAGNVKISSSERVLFQGGSIDGRFTTSAAFSNVESGAVGKGGDVVIDAPVLEVTDGAQLSASTFGEGNAGNVKISSSERVLFQGGNVDGRFSSAAFSLVESGAVGNGGKVLINAPIIKVTDGAGLAANTRGEGDAGNIQISSSEQVLFQNSAAVTNVGMEAVGKGGDIVIDAPLLEIINGAGLIASTLGEGDAGNVRITSTEQILLDGTDPSDGSSSVIFTSNGNIDADLKGTGAGGDVFISAPQLSVSNGALIDSRTVNNQPGGSIAINIESLAMLNGGQIQSISDGNGRAGNIIITAINQMEISGTDPTFTARKEQFGSAVAPTSKFSTLTVRSNNGGPAGNIILSTRKLTLNDSGQIIAESSIGNGGSISIGTKPKGDDFADLPTISPDAIFLKGNSVISTTVGDNQNPGDGGNITIEAPFIIGFPGNNSDIIANSFEGTGGNITINANAILNFQLQDEPNVDELRNNKTNDIVASSQSGNDGTLNLNGVNADPTRGIAQLPTTISSPQPSQGCEAAGTTSQQSQSEFFATGRGGLPPTPSNSLSSSNILDDLRFPPEFAANAANLQTPEATTNALAEATQWTKNAQGEVILTAQASDKANTSRCKLLSQG